VSEEAQEQTAAVENQPQLSVEEVQGPPPAAAVVAGQPEERIHEPPVEAGATIEPGIIHIARILDAPTITVVRSTL
jgi:hypothetical protein